MPPNLYRSAYPGGEKGAISEKLTRGCVRLA